MIIDFIDNSYQIKRQNNHGSSLYFELRVDNRVEMLQNIWVYHSFLFLTYMRMYGCMIKLSAVNVEVA